MFLADHITITLLGLSMYITSGDFGQKQQIQHLQSSRFTLYSSLFVTNPPSMYYSSYHHHLSWSAVIYQLLKRLLGTDVDALSLFIVCVRHSLERFCMDFIQAINDGGNECSIIRCTRMPVAFFGSCPSTASFVFIPMSNFTFVTCKLDGGGTL